MRAYDCDCINNLEYDRCERKQKEQPQSTTGQLNDGARSTAQSTNLIDRQAAIDLFPNDVLEWDTLNGYIAPHVARRLIEQLPPAQPEPHEGRFERKRYGVFCSVCHHGWEFITGVPAEVEREYHYCPYCGEKMKGAEHETN